MKFLLVEDNPNVRELIRQIIKEEFDTDSTFSELDDGLEVLNSYEKFRPDWVLMDIQMKSVDGLTASKTLLRHHPDARVIIVTQFDDVSYRNSAREQGVLAYVLKDNLLDIPALLNNLLT